MKVVYYAMILWLDRLREYYVILYCDNDVYVNELRKLFIRELAIALLRDIVMLIINYNIIVFSI